MADFHFLCCGSPNCAAKQPSGLCNIRLARNARDAGCGFFAPKVTSEPFQNKAKTAQALTAQAVLYG